MAMTGKPGARIRHHLIARDEIASIDLRSEAEFALGHPLFTSQIPIGRVAAEFPFKVPR